MSSRQDSPTVTVRPLELADSGPLAVLYRDNRAYLAPYEPERDEDFFTDAGQASRVAAAHADLTQERAFPYIIEVDGRIVGRVNVTNVSRGPFCSGSLGYWVARSQTGRGVASAAVAQALEDCFTRHQLHRVEAATLVDNAASQAVLSRNGFSRIGLAPGYLRIAGQWRDHLLFQRLAEDPRSPGGS